MTETHEIQLIMVDYRGGSTNIIVRIKYVFTSNDGHVITSYKNVSFPIAGIMNENAVKRLKRRVENALGW